MQHTGAGGVNVGDPAVPVAEENGVPLEDSEQVYSNCPNTCCTGAFIQEAMAGVIMSADIRELIFTSEQVLIRKLQHLPFRVPQKIFLLTINYILNLEKRFLS